LKVGQALDSAGNMLVKAFRNTPRGWFWTALLDPGQFVMERKMLVEIKRRAERDNAAPRRASYG
jgi:hypothetical protein